MTEGAALLAFLGALALAAPLALVAHVRVLRPLIRPLAMLGVGASLYTLVFAVARLAHWDVGLTHARLLAAGTRSNADVVASMLIPIWPYAAAIVGLALAAFYTLIACCKDRFVAIVTAERDGTGRIARQRARVARFDE